MPNSKSAVLINEKIGLFSTTLAPRFMSETDNIIPFEFRGNQYFFWYYLSTPHFGEILAENIDISQSFMLAEVIELFDIRVVD